MSAAYTHTHAHTHTSTKEPNVSGAVCSSSSVLLYAVVYFLPYFQEVIVCLVTEIGVRCCTVFLISPVLPLVTQQFSASFQFFLPL